MTGKDLKSYIEGYDEIQSEIAVLRKYGQDHAVQKGLVAHTINSLHPRELSLKVSEIWQETPSTKTFRLISPGQWLPPFQAGQYINLFVEIGGVRTSRPYSLSSPPTQTAFYDLTVRRVEDGFVSDYLLDEVRPGHEFRSTAPAGHFYYNPLYMGRDLVFLAGGSGITPILSMIREMTDRGLDRELHLVYGSRLASDIICRDELALRAERHANLKVSHVLSEPAPGYDGLTGFMDADLLGRLLGDTTEKMFFVCGPPIMYQFCRAELSKLGVPRRRIRTEVFGLPRDITSEPGWPREIARERNFTVQVRGGSPFQAAAGESLLTSLEKAGYQVPSCCRSGECSLCRIKLVSGRVFQPATAKVRKSDRRFGYVHACSTYPLDDLEILL
jgi:ferredoxin-NADP reductase